MTTLIEKSSARATFELDLTNKKVYMSVDCTNFMNDQRFVVIIETKSFLKLWRNEPSPLSRNLNFGNIENWKRDRKYPDAEDGFSFGRNNPVPLANIVCYINDENNLPYIAISNGVTRTIWLLSNNVKYFPVECRNKDEAELLIKAAGYKDTDISTVEKLLKCSKPS